MSEKIVKLEDIKTKKIAIGNVFETKIGKRVIKEVQRQNLIKKTDFKPGTKFIFLGKDESGEDIYKIKPL